MNEYLPFETTNQKLIVAQNINIQINKNLEIPHSIRNEEQRSKLTDHKNIHELVKKTLHPNLSISTLAFLSLLFP